MGEPAGYFLWCWENPLPDRPVERIEVIPRGPRFIIAAVTTSDVDEHPFVRAPSRPVRLVPKDGRGGVLDIDVDRGVATYPQPLPGEDDRPGWGAAEGDAAYASIAALPSATVAVRRGDDELGRVRWGDVERDGRADAGRVSLELAESGRNWVHVTRRRRRDRAAGAVPGPLPIDRGNPVPAARPPQSRHPEPRQLALRRRRRRPPGPAQLRLHRRHLPGLAAARRRRGRRRPRVRVRAAAADGADRAGSAGADAPDRAGRRPGVGRLVVGRLARALPVDPGRPARAAGRGSARRQPAAGAVGRAVHQHRGFLRAARRRRRRRLRDLRRPGEPAAHARALAPVGPEGTGHAVVKRRPRRGRARRRA